MACDPATLAADSKCLLTLGDRQLLASIAYMLAVDLGQDPAPANLTALGDCLATAMNERQLLAAIAYLQCQLAGG